MSFDGATREEFERIRTPLKFDAVVQNVVELVKLRNALRSKLKVHVACCSTTDKEATMRSLAKVVDGFAFGKLHNWGGQSAVRKWLRKPCSRLWRTFTVLANGDVALCCLDYDGQQLLGRVDDSAFDSRRVERPALSGNPPLTPQARQSEIPLAPLHESVSVTRIHPLPLATVGWSRAGLCRARNCHRFLPALTPTLSQRERGQD